MADRLTEDQITAGMARIPAWERSGDRIVRDFQFADFVAALGFIVEVGALAERAQQPALGRRRGRRGSPST